MLQLSARIANGDGLGALTPFLEVFFLIWWAWTNFTWFASSYDTDNVVYRLLTLAQMAGVLVLAAGVPAAPNHDDFLAISVGYLIMRVGLVVLELSLPLWSERKRHTSWHPHHIAERYGLFAILVLGEEIFAESSGLQTAIASGESAPRR
jgi:low temperature requirement protein LtrA